MCVQQSINHSFKAFILMFPASTPRCMCHDQFGCLEDMLIFVICVYKRCVYSNQSIILYMFLYSIQTHVVQMVLYIFFIQLQITLYFV